MSTVEPVAQWFVPPYPKALISGYSGFSAADSTGGGASAASGASSSQVPDTYDLEWVAGDTAIFEFYFDGVCWTDVQPANPQGLTWVMTDWAAQVRAPHYTYYGYWWPPTWPGYQYLMAFTVTSEFMDDFNGLGPGTMVTLNGGTAWPGSFVWDLQTSQAQRSTDMALGQGHHPSAGDPDVALPALELAGVPLCLTSRFV